MNPQKRIGLDIEPKYEGIIQQDFLSYTPTNQSYICIGNPPFGRVSSLAIKFFNKCAQFSDCIAFIIPRTFNKVSVQNKLNLNFILQYSEDLPLNPCCFTPKMSAKCCFQIWIRSSTPRQMVVYNKTHPDFDFIPYGEKDNNNQPIAIAFLDPILEIKIPLGRSDMVKTIIGAETSKLTKPLLLSLIHI